MIGYIILAAVAVFLAVVAVRTAAFKPKAQPKISDEEITFDYISTYDVPFGYDIYGISSRHA